MSNTYEIEMSATTYRTFTVTANNVDEAEELAFHALDNDPEISGTWKDEARIVNRTLLSKTKNKEDKEIYSGVIRNHEVMLRALDEESWIVDVRRDSDNEYITGYQTEHYKDATHMYNLYLKHLEIYGGNQIDICFE
jgi:hypothetical protein